MPKLVSKVNGKAKLIHCDGLDHCLPVCPTNALNFEVREAVPFDEKAVKKNMEKHKRNHHESSFNSSNTSVHTDSVPCCYPESNSKAIERKTKNISKIEQNSCLMQWPVQIKLISVNNPYFEDAKFLIAAYCTVFAYDNFHEKFIKDHRTLIGCSKLDEGDYSEKLTTIIKENNIKSVTVIQIEVSCCVGIANAFLKQLENSGKMIYWEIMTISTDGKIIGK